MKGLKKSELKKLLIEKEEIIKQLQDLRIKENEEHENVISEFRKELNVLKKENKKIKEEYMNKTYTKKQLEEIEYLKKRYKTTLNKMYLDAIEKI